MLDDVFTTSLGGCTCPVCGLHAEVYTTHDVVAGDVITCECPNGHSLYEEDIHSTFKESSCASE